MKPFLILLLTLNSQSSASLTLSQIECRIFLESVVESIAAAEADRKNQSKVESIWERLKALRGHSSENLRAASPLLEVDHFEALEWPEARGAAIPSEVDSMMLESIRYSVLHHGVAGLCHLPNYDPNGSIGFCFGRAMAAHFRAVLEGVPENDIKKVYIKGDFNDPVEREEYWHYHVTTAIRTRDGIWFATDPRLSAPVTIREWGRYWAAFAHDGVEFLVFDPDVLWPHGGRYEGYFRRAVRETPGTGSVSALVYAYMKALIESYHAEFEALER